VGEWLKPAVLKTVRPERVSWVRIPPPPPASLDISLYSFQFGRNRYFAAQLGEITKVICSVLQSYSANGLDWLQYSPRRIRRFPSDNPRTASDSPLRRIPPDTWSTSSRIIRVHPRIRSGTNWAGRANVAGNIMLRKLRGKRPTARDDVVLP
jgi:hypothetical protein